MIWAGTGVIWTLNGVVPKSVKAGTTIVFRNQDDIPHSVVGAKGEFHSKALDTDDVFEFTFAKAGTYATP